MQNGFLNRLISDPLSLGWWNNYPRFWAHHRRYSLPIRVPLRTRQRGVCCRGKSHSNTTCQVLSRRSWWIVSHWCHVRVGGNTFLIYYTLGQPKIFEVSITQPANWSLCQNVMACNFLYQSVDIYTHSRQSQRLSPHAFKWLSLGLMPLSGCLWGSTYWCTFTTWTYV